MCTHKKLIDKHNTLYCVPKKIVHQTHRDSFVYS